MIFFDSFIFFNIIHNYSEIGVAFILYPRFEEEGWEGVDTVLGMFILPSVTNIFRRTFPSNHASQPLGASASARGPNVASRIQVRQLSNSCFPARFIFGFCILG